MKSRRIARKPSEPEKGATLTQSEWDNLVRFPENARVQAAVVEVDGLLLMVGCDSSSHRPNTVTAVYDGDRLVCPLCKSIVTFENHAPTASYCPNDRIKWIRQTKGEEQAETARVQLLMRNEDFYAMRTEAAKC